MRINPHRTERLNVVNAARALKMSVAVLGERIQRGDVQTEYIAGYTFIPLDEIDRFAAELEEERRVAEVEERERAAEEQRERDGAFIAREMAHLQELAERHGFVPDGKE